jgi:hypothetical protein
VSICCTVSKSSWLTKGFVDDVVGGYPLVAGVPAHDCGVAQGDVVDVEEDFVGALFVPYLAAGVAGVGEDDADGAFGPADAVAVAVAGAVVRGGAGDVVAGEGFGDGEDAVAGEVHAEDAPHDRCGLRVWGQAVQVFAVCGLGGVGVLAEVLQHVAVGWASAEVSAFQLGLGRHGGADPDFDPVAFAFAHPAED